MPVTIVLEISLKEQVLSSGFLTDRLAPGILKKKSFEAKKKRGRKKKKWLLNHVFTTDR